MSFLIVRFCGKGGVRGVQIIEIVKLLHYTHAAKVITTGRNTSTFIFTSYETTGRIIQLEEGGGEN